jgi:general secretion pathway protein C
LALPAQWLNQSSEVSGRVGAALTGAFTTLSQPAHARRLRQILIVLFAVWAVVALARLVWALLPVTEPATDIPAAVINPVSTANVATPAATANLERMITWHLFGEAGAPEAVAPEPPPAAKTSAREGIEEGARETKLQLKMRGIVASTDDGLGYAIIEHQSRQAVYAVEDKLPVPGEVVLAKVMPQQIVLDNGGTYELLVLFDASSLDGMAAAAPVAPAPAAEPELVERNDPQTTSLASSYRQRLYENPQSLVEVVSVSAVREGSRLSGYKIQPGKDREQFEQLGFKPGDLVTAINGVSLDNPANTMVLYNTMRTAGEAVFELERDGQPLTLSVNLDSGGAQ